MEFTFSGVVIEWRGPAPYLFVPTPSEATEMLRDLSPRLTYGWGCIPAEVEIGQTRVRTALFPKDGGYLIPIKVELQRKESVGLGDEVCVRLHVAVLGE